MIQSASENTTFPKIVVSMNDVHILAEAIGEIVAIDFSSESDNDGSDSDDSVATISDLAEDKESYFDDSLAISEDEKECQGANSASIWEEEKSYRPDDLLPVLPTETESPSSEPDSDR